MPSELAWRLVIMLGAARCAMPAPARRTTGPSPSPRLGSTSAAGRAEWRMSYALRGCSTCMSRA